MASQLKAATALTEDPAPISHDSQQPVTPGPSSGLHQHVHAHINNNNNDDDNDNNKSF